MSSGHICFQVDLQPGCLTNTNLSVLSAPENTYEAGKVFALSGGRDLHSGCTWIAPEAIDKDVLFRSRLFLAMTSTRTSVPGEKTTNSAPCGLRRDANIAWWNKQITSTHSINVLFILNFGIVTRFCG